jgi:hypothetical protein
MDDICRWLRVYQFGGGGGLVTNDRMPPTFSKTPCDNSKQLEDVLLDSLMVWSSDGVSEVIEWR